MSLLSFERYCPWCQSRDVHRSKFRGWMEMAFIPFLLMRPYRCMKCDSRYFDLFFAVRIHGPEKEIHGSLVDF